MGERVLGREFGEGTGMVGRGFSFGTDLGSCIPGQPSRRPSIGAEQGRPRVRFLSTDFFWPGLKLQWHFYMVK